LRSISSDERKTWVDFGIAIKHDLGDAGLATWLTWSRSSAKFDLDEALKTWESFKSMSTGPKITLGTIYYMARERGWVDQAMADYVPEHIAQINQSYFLAPQGGKTEVFKEGVDPFDGHHRQAMGLSDFGRFSQMLLVESYDPAAA
jgi:hypothetical protein